MRRAIKRIRKHIKKNGYITILLILLIVAFAVLLVAKKQFSPPDQSPDILSGKSAYCRPEVNVQGSSGQYTFKDESPSIQAPTYSTQNVRSIQPNGDSVWYRRIKAEVPILAEVFSGGRGCDETREQCSTINESKHFQAFAGDPGIRKVDAKRYRIYFPIGEAGELKSKQFNTDTGNSQIDFKDNHLLFLVQLEDTGTFAKMDIINSCLAKNGGDDPGYHNPYDNKPGNQAKMWYVDIYQQAVPTSDGKASVTPLTYLPQDVLVCQDSTDIVCSVPTTTVINGNQNTIPTGDQKQLQLKTFPLEKQTKAFFYTWYTPECKPAIYLYPQEKTQVHVEVNTKGFLTYTNPLYPSAGWDVIADPSGTIMMGDKQFDYLYYESKIPDSLIQKPQEGYVVPFEKLGDLYVDILPKLGLNQVQVNDFKAYWSKALPKSPYYFVGVVSQESIDAIEPLTIIPKPATMIRVRLYFEALSTWKNVKEPTFVQPKRNGFTVVEWGGMVKTDKNHPFTCSQ